MRPFRCWFRHRWEVQQEVFLTENLRGEHSGVNREIVIAWKQCKRCGASHLLHILK